MAFFVPKIWAVSTQLLFGGVPLTKTPSTAACRRGRKDFGSPCTSKQAHAAGEHERENADERHAPVPGMRVVECDDCAYE